MFPATQKMKKGSGMVSSLVWNSRLWWTKTKRRERDRSGQKFLSDEREDCLRDEAVVVKSMVTDDEWQIVVENDTKQLFSVCK